MTSPTKRLHRRTVLKGAASLAAASAAPTLVSATPVATGKPGDFDFLTGEWRIKHRRLKAPGEWDVFEGEATCWSIIGGVGHVEELRIPARNFSGSGLRYLDLETRIWSDFWVNAKSGVLGAAGLTGGFVDGVGMFTADDTDADGKPVKVAGIWDQITGKSHRWRQGVSKDGGATWDYSWLMDWVKV